MMVIVLENPGGQQAILGEKLFSIEPPIIKDPHAVLQCMIFEYGIIKIPGVDVLCTFIVQQQLGKNTAWLYSLLDQFDDDRSDILLIIVKVDKGIIFISTG